MIHPSCHETFHASIRSVMTHLGRRQRQQWDALDAKERQSYCPPWTEWKRVTSIASFFVPDLELAVLLRRLIFSRAKSGSYIRFFLRLFLFLFQKANSSTLRNISKPSADFYEENFNHVHVFGVTQWKLETSFLTMLVSWPHLTYSMYFYSDEN